MSTPAEKVNALIEEINAANPADAAALEQFRIQYLGSKNVIKPLFGEIRNVPNEEKKAYGQLVNSAKEAAQTKFDTLKVSLSGGGQASTGSAGIDLTAPGDPFELGSRHPVTAVMNRITDIFQRIGFTIAENREIEDDWTHTSCVQSRVMTTSKPPIRIIAPGRVYRNETISARSHCQFHQVEGLYVDENVSFADMKQTIYYFAQEMYGKGTKIRLRPSYFPFTEPSAEVDVSCFLCDAKGCNVCKKTGWVEIGGCGMVDPAVLENCDIDPDKYTGYAFGMGIERQAMMKYKINDIRLLFENDIRFLKQFTSII